MNPVYLLATAAVILAAFGVYLWKKMPEKSALLTALGIWLVFFVGLIFTNWLPSFNKNWSAATADDLPHYHVQYANGTATPAGYTPSQLNGRLVYQREGCMYCHSQQIRPLEGEMKRYSIGKSLAIPSDEREYVYDRPHFLGTRRIGPDLSREGGKYSDDWQYSHFYYPRQLVPESIMPAFTWLFTKEGDAPPVPTQDARDLVAYIQTLGYGRQVYDKETGTWHSWLRADDQQATQDAGEAQVERITPNANGYGSVVRGGDKPSSTNVAVPR